MNASYFGNKHTKAVEVKQEEIVDDSEDELVLHPNIVLSSSSAPAICSREPKSQSVNQTTVHHTITLLPPPTTHSCPALHHGGNTSNTVAGQDVCHGEPKAPPSTIVNTVSTVNAEDKKPHIETGGKTASDMKKHLLSVAQKMTIHRPDESPSTNVSDGKRKREEDNSPTSNQIPESPRFVPYALAIANGLREGEKLLPLPKRVRQAVQSAAQRQKRFTNVEKLTDLSQLASECTIEVRSVGQAAQALGFLFEKARTQLPLLEEQLAQKEREKRIQVQPLGSDDATRKFAETQLLQRQIACLKQLARPDNKERLRAIVNLVQNSNHASNHGSSNASISAHISPVQTSQAILQRRDLVALRGRKPGNVLQILQRNGATVCNPKDIILNHCKQFIELAQQSGFGVNLVLPKQTHTRQARRFNKFISAQHEDSISCPRPACGGTVSFVTLESPSATSPSVPHSAMLALYTRMGQPGKCDRCGHLIDMNESKTMADPQDRPPRRKQEYYPPGHLESILQRLQGKENVKLDDKRVLERLREEMVKRNITDPATQLNFHKVRKWLDRLGLGEYMDNVHLITDLLGGPKPVEIPEWLQKKFHEMFQRFLEVYPLYCRGRQHGLTTRLLLYRLAVHLRQDWLCPYLPPLKTGFALTEQNEIINDVFEELGWLDEDEHGRPIEYFCSRDRYLIQANRAFTTPRALHHQSPSQSFPQPEEEDEEGNS